MLILDYFNFNNYPYFVLFIILFFDNGFCVILILINNSIAGYGIYYDY